MTDAVRDREACEQAKLKAGSDRKDWPENYGSGFNAGWQAALAYRDREGWISVEERLPDVSQLVLFAVVGRKLPEMGCWRADDQNWQSVETAPCDELIFFGEDQVTHWRPLPASPEGKELR